MKASETFFPLKPLIFTLLFVSLRLYADAGPVATVESLHHALLAIARMTGEDNFEKKYAFT